MIKAIEKIIDKTRPNVEPKNDATIATPSTIAILLFEGNVTPVIQLPIALRIFVIIFLFFYLVL